MSSKEIRRRFLQYFQSHGHALIPSSPVVPHEDPTLLFTNAGMNQFKDVFLGKSARDYKRATTSQKCIRVGGKHNDLDNVGHTTRHLTFFEMLGNFSFGDYFKEQAIAFAWEVTKEVFEFPLEKIWITVFEQDDEAYQLWQKFVPKNRIVHMGEKDNFWAMGDTGPCGPCSELYFDRGESYGTAKNPKEDASGERYLEFWNLVFMQFNRDTQGRLDPLPNKSIDTGSGLERVLSLKMQVDNVFHTDVLLHLIQTVAKISKRPYDPKNAMTAPAYHVIADHIRSLSFAIADGAQPSNIERGYVLRKLLRRAVRYGKSLGLQDPFLAQMLPALLDVMGEDYPELVSAKSRIAEILTLEEESFIRTLKRGGNILSNIIESALRGPLKQISGEEAFKLKDTYGFPLEEILLIAKDYGLQVNIDAYQLLEEQAKEKSRAAQVVHHQQAEESLYRDFVKKQEPTLFTGYQTTQEEAQIIGLIKEGQFVDKLSDQEEGCILLDRTPFYAEKGGQVADSGFLEKDQALFKVTDCQNSFPGIISHIGQVTFGSFQTGDRIFAKIDQQRRKCVEGNHTATHLLHWALQRVLGTHIRQAGSLVEEKRLRFDFNHHKPLSPEELKQIEDLVNEKIRENALVNAYEIPYEEAQSHPEIKQFFGEKYGHHVRVIDINYSKELCGGTHVHHVGNIGYFRITKESSIAAGVRRIEATTGKFAEEFVRAEEDLFNTSAALLKAPLAKLPEKIQELLGENATLKTQLRTFKLAQIKEIAQEMAKKIEKVHGIPFLGRIVDLEVDEIPVLADEMIAQIGSLCLLLAIQLPERCHLFMRVSPDLVQKGVHAASLIKTLAPIIEGGGGGKADSAQAGGKKPDQIHKALETAKECLLKL